MGRSLGGRTEGAEPFQLDVNLGPCAVTCHQSSGGLDESRDCAEEERARRYEQSRTHDGHEKGQSEEFDAVVPLDERLLGWIGQATKG